MLVGLIVISDCYDFGFLVSGSMVLVGDCCVDVFCALGVSLVV